MATAVLPETNVTRISSGRRYEHLFFSGMALLILATVVLGFARTYFLAGVFRAPLPNLLIHLHGAAFSSWILLRRADLSRFRRPHRYSPPPGRLRISIGLAHGHPGYCGRH